MNFHDRKVIPPKYIYLFLSIICFVLLFLSIVFESRFSVLKAVTSTLITPMQTGVNSVGSSMYNSTVERKEKLELIEKNKELTALLEEYKAANKKYEQENYELKRLQELLQLKEQYVEYNTIGARVIATDSTNWFYTFIIDKGKEDGVNVGCNILANGGLAGIVTETGSGYSKVRAIIDDNSNISASISGCDSLCTITGDISAMKEGYILVNYIDKAAVVDEGAEIVTSHVSNKFLPGLLIGYIEDVSMDSNNLTQSAKCIPVVDFSNLQEVLVVLDLKANYKTDSTNKNIFDNINKPDSNTENNSENTTENATENTEEDKDSDSTSDNTDGNDPSSDGNDNEDSDPNDSLPDEPSAEPLSDDDE